MKKTDTRTKQQKQSKRKIGLTVLLALLLVIGAATFALREEIALLYFAITTPEAAVESKKSENDKKTQELLEEIALQTMRDLTEEERRMLASGELSAEQAMALILGETLRVSAETTAPVEGTTAVPTTEVITSAPVTEPPIPETTAVVSLPEPIVTVPATTAATTVTTAAATTTTTAATTVATTAATTAATTVATTVTTTVTASTTATTPAADQATLLTRQNEIIAEIYLLRATYLNEIDALIQGMKDEYAALPEEERGFKAKMKIAEKTMPKGNALEDACDARMEELLAELTKILQQSGSSTAIIDEIEETYLEQKVLKKTELYNQYFPKLQK